MSLPTIQILLGTLLLAGGGLLATYGWNAKFEADRKSAMVRSVGAELLVNSAVVRDPMFTETDDKKLSLFVMFPRVSIAVLEGAISSGLFLKEDDRPFFTRAANLRELLTQFNVHLTFTETEMSFKPQHITAYRTKLRDGKTREQLTNKLKIFGKLLVSDYGIRESDVFFVPLEEEATLPDRP